MAKYFGFKNKQDMIDDIKEGELWIYYKDDSTYVFTLDGHGYNLLNDKLYGEFTTSEHQEKNRYTNQTITLCNSIT